MAQTRSATPGKSSGDGAYMFLWISGGLRHFLKEVEILPLAAVQPVQFFRRQEELLHNTVLGIELHKISVQESIEAA